MNQEIEEYKTVASGPTELLKIIILERRKFLIDAIEHYNRRKFDNRSASISNIRAEMISLFLEIQAALRRDYKDEEYKELYGMVNSKEPDVLLDAFFQINQWLDEKKLIRVDTKKQYDSTRVESENREKSL